MKLYQENIATFYNKLVSWCKSQNTSGPSSPPDFAMPDMEDGFEPVVREWLSDVLSYDGIEVE